MKDLGDRARDLLGPLVVRGVVADEPQVLDLFLAGVLELEIQRLGPVGPLAGRLAERIAVALEVHQGVLEALVDLPLVDQVPAQVDDQPRLLDVDGADLFARPARAAGPKLLGPNRANRGGWACRRCVLAASAQQAARRTAWTTSRGESGKPVLWPGQASWHLPHQVQASTCSNCRQVRSRTVRTPDSAATGSRPAGATFAQKSMLTGEEIRWKALVKGIARS